MPKQTHEYRTKENDGKDRNHESISDVDYSRPGLPSDGHPPDAEGRPQLVVQHLPERASHYLQLVEEGLERLQDPRTRQELKNFFWIGFLKKKTRNIKHTLVMPLNLTGFNLQFVFLSTSTEASVIGN